MKKIISFLLFFTIFITSHAQVTVADGTNTSHHTPIYPYYGYSYSQVIYAADILNADAGNITGIKYYYNASASYDNSDGNLTVWIGLTSKNEFASGTDWVDISTLTQVFSGSVTFDGSGELTITFNTPFSYDGSSNIIVAVDENEPGYDTNQSVFYGGDLGGPVRRIYTRHDTNNPDPANPPAGTTGTTGAKITFLGLTQTSCPAPTGLNATPTSTTDAQLDWTETGSANAWQIEWGPTGFSQGTGTLVSTTNKPYFLGGLTAGGVYDFYVRSDCGGGDYSNWSGPFTWSQIPANDDCANALALNVYAYGSGGGNEITTSTEHATASSMSQTSCDNVGTNLDLFYSFTAPSNGNLRILSGGPKGSALEAAIYSACGGSDLACFDRSAEKIVTGLTPGQNYFLQVWHDNTQAGVFTLVLEEGPPTPPNDDCSNATEVASLPFSETLDARTATNQQFPDCNGELMNDGVWYTLVTGNPGGDITVDVTPQNWDVEIAVFSGTCSNLTCVQSADDGIINVAESITFTADPNTRYYINVGRPESTTDEQEGIFDIQISGSVTLDLENTSPVSFDLYPNPVKDYISWSAAIHVKKLELRDVTGKIILTVEPQSNNLNLSHLKAGIYIVNLYTENKIHTTKLLKL